VKLRNVLLTLFTLLLTAMGVQAQDPGIPDTVDLVVTVCPVQSTGQFQVQMDFYVFSDYTNSASSIGFSWDNPNLQMDSAIATSLTDVGYDMGPFFYEDNDINLTNAIHIFLTRIGISRTVVTDITQNITIAV